MLCFIFTTSWTLFQMGWFESACCCNCGKIIRGNATISFVQTFMLNKAGLPKRLLLAKLKHLKYTGPYSTGKATICGMRLHIQFREGGSSNLIRYSASLMIPNILGGSQWPLCQKYQQIIVSAFISIWKCSLQANNLIKKLHWICVIFMKKKGLDQS